MRRLLTSEHGLMLPVRREGRGREARPAVGHLLADRDTLVNKGKRRRCRLMEDSSPIHRPRLM